MKLILAIFVGMFLAGCSQRPSMQDVRAYGEQRFIDDVLAVADGKPASQTLLTAFRPLRIEPHLNGAWLLYSDSARYQAGIYVDRKSLDNWAGSGMDVTRWSDRIGWTEEEIRVGRVRIRGSSQ